LRLKHVFGFLLLGTSLSCSQPEFEISNGDVYRLSNYQGQWLLINYWAVWCKPCVAEIPELNEIDQREDISVFGYNFDNNRGELLQAQVEKLNIMFPLLINDPAEKFGQKTPTALPATMLIDTSGQFRVWLLGPQTQQTIKDQISALSSASS